jgi:putative colanic acid biosynthesis glycosyltransferase WcaI
MSRRLADARRRLNAADSPLRIALLSASYSPEPTGIGPYSGELAEALAARGNDVRVVAAFPFYPRWRLEVPRGTLLYRTDERDGVRVTRCRLYVPRDPQPGRRLAHEVSWMLSAAALLPRLVVWADVWLVVTPSFGSAVLGALLARGLGSRVHLHVQDVVPDVAIESGQLGSGLMGRVAGRVARWTYRSFRSVSVLSESMAMRLRRYTAGTPQAELIAPNWVRNGSVTGGRLPEELIGRPYALYSGSFSRKQDLALVTQAARLLLERRGPAIVVLGDGPGRDALERGGENLIRLGLVDEGTYQAVLRHALAGIVALSPGVGDSVVPSKLAAYLGAGRPVVVAADADCDAARVVGWAKCGLRIPPGRADLLADALCLLGTDQAQWQSFAASGLMYAKVHWEKVSVVGRIEAALRALRGS